MEKKVNSKKTAPKTETQKLKTEIKELKAENQKLRAVCYHLLKTHRVAPEGARLNKSEDEVNEMTLQTLDYLLKKGCSQIVIDYKRASIRKVIRKINK